MISHCNLLEEAIQSNKIVRIRTRGDVPVGKSKVVFPEQWWPIPPLLEKTERERNLKYLEELILGRREIAIVPSNAFAKAYEQVFAGDKRALFRAIRDSLLATGNDQSFMLYNHVGTLVCCGEIRRITTLDKVSKRQKGKISCIVFYDR